ncbi:MAG: cytochrome c maturation protein CcmE [Saprospiraceae bacterium]
MKKTHIIAIGMIAVAIALLISLSGDVSQYSSFAKAEASGEVVKIAGQLAKEKEMKYDPQVDPNYFSFHLKDTDGAERKVVLLAAKPQDFEKSEQIVLTGQMKDEAFVATDMLMKCPSKYKDEEVYIKSQQAEL